MVGVVQTMLTNYKTASAAPFVPPTYTTDSLCFLYYDPANPASYSGTGTALNNLRPYTVGNPLATPATIVNATYNSTLSSGVFTFVGSAGNQYIMTPNLSDYVGAAYKELTVEMWVYPTAAGSALMEVGQNSITTGWRTNVIESGSVGPFFNIRGGYINTSNTMTYNGANGSPALNRWLHLSLTTWGGSTGGFIGPNIYYNGTAGTTANVGTRKFPQTQSPLLSGQTANYFGWAFGAGSSQNSLALSSAMFTGRIGIIRVYSSVLSQAEIQSNFNAVRARYGV